MKPADIVLFVVMAVLSLVFVNIAFFPSPSQVGGESEFMLLIFLYPVAAVGAMIGLVKYRPWRTGFFWMLLVIVSFAVFEESLSQLLAGRPAAGRPHGMVPPSSLTGVWATEPFFVRDALIMTLAFAPIFVVVLWQFMMVVSTARRQP